MQAVEVLKQTVRQQERISGSVGYSTWIFIASVLMAVALIYVWSHIHMTELEYQVAREMSSREQLTEEQAKSLLDTIASRRTKLQAGSQTKAA